MSVDEATDNIVERPTGKLAFYDHEGNIIARIEGNKLTYVDLTALAHLSANTKYIFELMAKQGIAWP